MFLGGFLPRLSHRFLHLLEIVSSLSHLNSWTPYFLPHSRKVSPAPYTSADRHHIVRATVSIGLQLFEFHRTSAVPFNSTSESFCNFLYLNSQETHRLSHCHNSSSAPHTLSHCHNLSPASSIPPHNHLPFIALLSSALSFSIFASLPLYHSYHYHKSALAPYN